MSCLLRFIVAIALFDVIMTSAGYCRSELTDAELHGAQARIILRISDDEGVPVEFATVKVFMGMNFVEKSYFISGHTNTNGEFVVEGKTTGNEIEIEVGKTGYYTTKRKLCFILMGHEYDVKDGKWQPWGMNVSLPMRKVISPIPLVAV